MLHGHVAELAARLQPIGRLPAAKRLDLVLGLPLRNSEAATVLLRQMYEPDSTNFHRYLTSQQFTEEFGPTEADYQTLIDYAGSNHFTIVGTHPNRAMLDVNVAVGDVERAFHVAMRVYHHPTEARTFYAPDVEPSLDLAIPVLHISGLDDHAPPRPNVRVEWSDKNAKGKPNAGSGTNGTFMAADLRAAYVPYVSPHILT